MTVSERQVVAALEDAIIQRIGEPRYKVWFAHQTHFECDDNCLTVGVPNLHFQEWLERKFGAVLAAAAAEVLGHAVEVRFHYPECGIKDAPPIALLLDGEAGHAYKPRIQIGQNAAGAPSCKARMFDVTSDGAGNKKDYY